MTHWGESHNGELSELLEEDFLSAKFPFSRVNNSIKAVQSLKHFLSENISLTVDICDGIRCVIKR